MSNLTPEETAAAYEIEMYLACFDKHARQKILQFFLTKQETEGEVWEVN